MNLTKSQIRVLTWLRDNKNEADGAITCDGLECWYGFNKTNWQMVNSLLQLVLVSDVSDTNGGTKRYAINGSGERALDGLPPYRDCDGNYHDDFYALIAAQNGKKR